MTEFTDVKWIKLMTGLFDSEKIQLIESMPEADSLIVLWVKLLCLAGKINNGGVFVMGDSIVYTEEMLSTVLRRPLRAVRRALEVFTQLDMVRRVDGVLTLPNWSRYQNLDALEKRRDYMRDYMRDYRRRQKRLAETAAGVQETPDVPPEEEGDGEPHRKPDAAPPREPEGELHGEVHGKHQEQNREEKRRTEQKTARPGAGREGEGIFRAYAEGDEALLTALKDFDIMRRALRKPMTDRARELLCRKLDTFPPEQRTAVLEQSVAHSWVDLYPPGERQSPQPAAPARRNGEGVRDDIRRLLAADAEKGA